MKKVEDRLVGILGTVIIHLIAGILFMSFQISSLQKDRPVEYEVELVPEEPSSTEKLVELPATTIEKIFAGDEEMLNIARNLSNKAEEKIDPSDYIDNVKEELIKSGKLGIDNYIDEQKRLDELKTSEKSVPGDEAGIENESVKAKETPVMDINYKGPTRIYYDLLNRNHIYMPVPIYKCQGSGKVVLSIEVNQKGIVEEASIIENLSTTSDQCLVETAIATALISRFNSDMNSPGVQKGTLTYHFVAQ